MKVEKNTKGGLKNLARGQIVLIPACGFALLTKVDLLSAVTGERRKKEARGGSGEWKIWLRSYTQIPI